MFYSHNCYLLSFRVLRLRTVTKPLSPEAKGYYWHCQCNNYSIMCWIMMKNVKFCIWVGRCDLLFVLKNSVLPYGILEQKERSHNDYSNLGKKKFVEDQVWHSYTNLMMNYSLEKWSIQLKRPSNSVILKDIFTITTYTNININF